MIDWVDALAWLAGIAAGAFLVSWILTDILHLRRAPYVGALAALTVGLTAGFVDWSGLGADFWSHHWPWGLLGAAIAGAFLAAMVSRIPAPRIGELRPGASGWEGVVYGTTEGLLLSVLPVAATWGAFSALGWTEGWAGAVTAASALAASVVVIVVHHLGYRGYRGRAIRSPLVGCAVLSLAYLATGSPIAAIGGHIVLHLAMLRRGIELPPHAPSGPLGEKATGATVTQRVPVGPSGVG